MRNRRKQRALTAHEVRQIAVEAMCDPATVRAFIEGRHPVRPLSEQRIVAALKRLGLDGEVTKAA